MSWIISPKYRDTHFSNVSLLLHGNGTNDKKITIDWDGTGDPATDAAAAITTLKSRNWQIYLNNVLQ